jgi:hypothetical protein
MSLIPGLQFFSTPCSARGIFEGCSTRSFRVTPSSPPPAEPTQANHPKSAKQPCVGGVLGFVEAYFAEDANEGFDEFHQKHERVG